MKTEGYATDYEWDQRSRTFQALGTTGPTGHRVGVAGRTPEIAVAIAAAALNAQPECPTALDQALVAIRSVGVDSGTRAEILEVADTLDGRYLDLFDDEKPGGRSDGWEAAFRLARAAAAICFAIDEDPTIAAIEASYEARHALDEGFDYRQAIRAPTMTSHATRRSGGRPGIPRVRSRWASPRAPRHG